MSTVFSSGDVIAIVVALLSSLTSIWAIYLQSKQHQKDVFAEKSLEVQGNVYAKLAKLASLQNNDEKTKTELDNTITYCLQSFPYMSTPMWIIITDLINHINDAQKQKKQLDNDLIAKNLKKFSDELLKRVK